MKKKGKSLFFYGGDKRIFSHYYFKDFLIYIKTGYRVEIFFYEKNIKKTMDNHILKDVVCKGPCFWMPKKTFRSFLGTEIHKKFLMQENSFRRIFCTQNV